MSNQEVDMGVFRESAKMILDYVLDPATKVSQKDLRLAWIGSMCTSNGIGAIMVETRSSSQDIRDGLDGLMGYVEIISTLDGLRLCCSENPQTKRVFVFHPDLISKESLEKGRFLSYSALSEETIPK